MVGQVSPGTLDRLEQSRETFDLRLVVLSPAFLDQVQRRLAGDHVLGAIGGCAENPDGVIVGENDVPDRLVGHLADTPDQILCGDRRGTGVDHHDGVIPDHDARSGVPSAE